MKPGIGDVDTEEKSFIVWTHWWTYSLLDVNEKASERHIKKAITDGGKWKHSMSRLSLCTNVTIAVAIVEFYYSVSVHLATALLNQ